MSKTFTVHTDAGHPIIFLVRPDPAGGLTAKAELHSIFVQGDTMSALQSAAVEAVRVHFAPSLAAMTRAKEAAGRTARNIQAGPQWETWEALDADSKARWIKFGMSIVAAHDAERWRVPTTEWGDGRKYLLIFSIDGGRWIGPFFSEIETKPENPSVAYMIADPLELPPAPGGGKA